MDKGNILPVTDARKELYSLIEACKSRSLTFVLTSKGRPVARLLSENEYESIMETMEVLSDKKQLQRLVSALKHVQKGELHSHEKVFGHRQPRLK